MSGYAHVLHAIQRQQSVIEPDELAALGEKHRTRLEDKVLV